MTEDGDGNGKTGVRQTTEDGRGRQRKQNQLTRMK
jgi:hypothetical protein